jgi:hypothetical protein
VSPTPRSARTGRLRPRIVRRRLVGAALDNTVFPGDIAAGVTELDSFSVLPFEFGDGRFAQVAGMRFTWDAAAPAGARVTEIVLDSGEVIVSGGAVQAGPPIGVATIDLSANGGDDDPLAGTPFVRSTVRISRPCSTTSPRRRPRGASAGSSRPTATRRSPHRGTARASPASTDATPHRPGRAPGRCDGLGWRA